MEYRYARGDEVVLVRVESAADGYSVSVDGRAYHVRLAAAPGRAAGCGAELALEVDAQRHLAWVAANGPRRWVAVDGQTCELAPPQSTSARGHAPGRDMLEAQMPGVVRRVLVAPGDHVERGQALVLLEAMKMEIRVSAPHAGNVQDICVREGQAVDRGETLVEIEADA